MILRSASGTGINQAMDTASSTAAEVAEWRRTGEAIRTKLVEERRELLARLAQVDAALASLPRLESPVESEKDNKSKNMRGAPPKGKRSVRAVVVDVVRESGTAMSAPEILAAVKKEVPKIDPRNVYSALYLTKHAKVLSASGSKGSLLYRYTGGP